MAENKLDFFISCYVTTNNGRFSESFS